MKFDRKHFRKLSIQDRKKYLKAIESAREAGDLELNPMSPREKQKLAEMAFRAVVARSK